MQDYCRLLITDVTGSLRENGDLSVNVVVVFYVHKFWISFGCVSSTVLPLNKQGKET